MLAACAARQTPTDDARSAAVSPYAYEHYVRARLASEDGDHDAAITELRLAATVAPDEPELAVAIAEEQILGGDDAGARMQLDATLKRFPSDGAAWQLSGRLRGHDGDERAAIADLEQSLRLAPDEETTYLLLAAAHKELGDPDGGLDAYRRLVARLPDSAEGHYRLGREMLLHHDAVGAELHLARAVELSPDSVEARVALAEIYRQTNRAELATQALKDAFERSGDDPNVGERLFHVLLEAGDVNGAVDLLKGLDADWREPAVRLQIGQLFLELHHADEALAIGKSLLDRDPTFQAARIVQARALGQLGQRAEAIKVCLAVPASADEFAEARALAGELDERDGAFKQGITVVEEGLARIPDDVGLITLQAQLYQLTGDVARARTILDTALKSPEGDGDDSLMYARASVEDRAGDPGAAIAIMQPLLDKDADNITALNFIGYSYAERGVKLDVAERYLHHAVELRPNDGYVLDSYGWLLFQQGKVDQAAQTLERADRLVPFEPEILLHLGELYLKRGDASKAKDVFLRALGCDPEDKVKKELEEKVRGLEASAHL
jgi:tetratricopeptide (TPR) repeat protein